MSKRRLTHGQQLQKMQKEAEPDSLLSQELKAVRIALEKPKNQAINGLIKLLKSSLQRETQWFIGKVFSTAKDEWVTRPLMRATKAPQNSTQACNFPWSLENYDCTKHLSFFVDTLLKHNDAGEAVWACIEIT